MSDRKVKVLYIAGYGRSGTTILDNVLGQVEGFFTAGELRYVWDRGLLKNWTCGCGRPFRECPFWEQVFLEAYGSRRQVNPELMIALREPVSRLSRHLLSWIPARNGQRPTREADEFSMALGRLYPAVARVAECDVVIDSSKWPSYGYALAQVPEIELYVVHLVRDPRGVAFSWTRTKKYEPFERSQVYIPKHGSLYSALFWLVWNVAVQPRWRRAYPNYLLVRYEDFMHDPVNTVRGILSFLGEAGRGSPLIEGQTVELKENHAVAGNPVRFARGKVKLQLDDEWRTKMRRVDKVMITALTWPLMYCYGYLGQAAARRRGATAPGLPMEDPPDGKRDSQITNSPAENSKPSQTVLCTPPQL